MVAICARNTQLQTNNQYQKNAFVYNLLFDHVHPIQALYNRFDDVYRNRWCKLNIFQLPRVRALCDRSINTLAWLSSQVPPRVHTANIRLQLNAWHTERRYQRRVRCRPCSFCRNNNNEDKLEHIFYCYVAKNIFPLRWRVGSDSIARCFFLRHDSDDDLLLGALLVYGLYAYHCHARHDAGRISGPEATQAVIRLIASSPWHGRLGRIWNDYAQSFDNPFL